MKIIKIMNTVTVVLKDGSILSSDNCTDKMFNDIYQNQDDEEYVKSLLLPEFANKREESIKKKDLLDNIENSKLLTKKGNSVYLLGISELSVPEDLVTAILKAELDDNKDLIETYTNFWTLVSLNPDSRCRQNMFWFLNKYGLKISKSGLFIAYRNVDIKREGTNISSRLAKFISSEYVNIKFVSKKNPSDYIVIDDEDGYDIVLEDSYDYDDYEVIGNLQELYDELSESDTSTTYTDGYTGTFNIKIGEIVSMPREKCDSVQENSCSRGLHVAGKDWLQSNYFGDTGMRVLVNPADVVAVPPIDNYGKMRTSAYYPINVVSFGEDGKIIEDDIEDGFEDDFFQQIVYGGNVNNHDIENYEVIIPDIPELNFSNINERLLSVARKLNKTVN